MIPPIYLLPLGLPLYWGNEQSGVLSDAVLAYFAHCSVHTPITDDQLNLVIAYIQHHINAPCWIAEAEDRESIQTVNRLRERARTLKTADDITAYIYDSLEYALDPL